VRVARERQIRAEAAVVAVKIVVAVRQQQPERVAVFRVDLLRELLRCLLIGVAVRVVDAREDDTVAVSRERYEFVREHRHAGFPQRALDLLHDLCAVAPLVVARDVIRRRDG